MNGNRKTAIIVGILFITATFTTSISQVLLTPILETPDFLLHIGVHSNQFVLGVLLELVNALASVSIAIAIFPVLKKYSEGIAIGYVSFRAIEATIGIIAATKLLSLLTLSQTDTMAENSITSDSKSLSTYLIAAHDWTFLLLLLVFSLGALMLYPALYNSQLVPRIISLWGLVGSIMLLIANLLILFGFTDLNSAIDNFLSLPIGSNEMVLAVWLIAKGFNLSAIDH
ncbi:hypothetical protein Xen7305DRAFT_00004920 [Xenococcus sp. PCC 7305]|uniref:DUF4386 domain-containing protein n=1 Tax=Xenococcus sp. PCC 7305 TaxID=102125 RepID=UPI0002AC5235|nr:DUF4386 domain-containing protein [Xenococcus sp. PCC 7305]ELS00791.1 hypothetical protein Xen7305DRAFT_00004920 [Xenococcus sp. PCC 7305]